MQILLAIANPSEGTVLRAADVLRRCGDVWPQVSAESVRVVRAAGASLLCAGGAGRGTPPGLHESPDAAFALDGIALLDGERAVSASELAAEPPGVERRLEGGHCWVRLDRRTSAVEAGTDPLGMQMLYAAQVEDGWAVSNSALVLLRIRGAAAWDLDGARSLLCLHGMGRGRSLFDGVRMIAGGEVWRWRPQTQEPATEAYFAPDDLAGLRADGVTDEQVAAACDVIRRQVRAAAATGRPLRAPITGGRDSRVLAAAIGAEGIDCDFFTSALPGSAEERSAVEVARVLGVAHRVHHPEASEVADRWDELVRRLFLQTDGLVSAWQVANAAAQDAHEARRPIVLGGHGGELARTPFGDATDLAPRGLTVARLARVLPLRMVNAFDGLLTAGTVTWTRDLVVDSVRKYADAGWDRRNVPDAVAFFERQRVRDAAAGRPGHPVRDMMLPFYSRSFIRLAMAASYRERYLSRVHERMLDVLAPAVRRVRYSQVPGWWHRPAKDALGRANAVLRSDRLRKKKVRTSPQQKWMLDVLPRVRATCLDAARSRLWEVADRDTFDRMTSPGEISRLPARADGILKVYSLFEFERLAGVR